MNTISFIVIGRNEGWKLSKCLESIFRTIEYNSLSNYEVIYIDSLSSDNSIENAKNFNSIKIFQLTNDYNAGIARNVGAKESIGDILFFIDGDMEIIPDFLSKVYSQKSGLVQPFISANWMNHNYSSDGVFLNEEKYLTIKKDRIEKVTGGLFLITKNAWEKVNGIRNVFKISEDIDLGLRLAQNNVFLHRKKEIAANHHTISYMDKNRMWLDLKKGNEFYARSLLYRKNIFNPHSYLRLLRNDYSLILLIIIIISSLIIKSLIIAPIYFMLIIIKSIKKANKNILSILNFTGYYIARDVLTFLGLFFFYPKKKFIIQYNRIR